MKTQNHPLRTAVASAVLASAGLTSLSALAATPERPDAAARAEIEQNYRTERAACTDGSSTQERSACLAEASAVRKEAMAGVLGLQKVASSGAVQPTEPDLIANALARCDAVPSDVRGDCERRVAGGADVIVIGSVAEGVIIRELPAVQAPQVVAQAAQADIGNPSSEAIDASSTAPLAPSAADGQVVAESQAPTAAGLSAGEALVPTNPAQATGLALEPAAETVAEPAAPTEANAAAAAGSQPAPEPAPEPATEPVAMSPVSPAIEPAIAPAGDSAADSAADSAVTALPDARVEPMPDSTSGIEAGTPGDDLAPTTDAGPAAGADPVAYPEWMVLQRFE